MIQPFVSAPEQVDVIIPAHGALPLVLACLGALERWSVTLVDDASPEEAKFKVLPRRFPHLQYLRQEVNQGFIAACRLGAQQTNKPYVLFLNSDVLPNDRAIEALYTHLAFKGGAIAGCRLLFPGTHGLRVIQHAGVARNSQGVPYHPFMRLIEQTPHAQRDLAVNAVTGAALMIRREVWENLWGFDAIYGPGVYEDVDLCWRCRHAEGKVWYVGSEAMEHHMHGSQAQGNNWFGANAQRNLQQLMMRFGNQGSDEDLFYGGL